MPRIPDEEIERLKREVSVERLAEARGVKLKRHGADLIGLCPFHEDREPSLVISPDKNLWHCLGACQAGGSVIDWVMKAEGVSFRHAAELLRSDHSSLAAASDPPTDNPQPPTSQEHGAAGDLESFAEPVLALTILRGVFPTAIHPEPGGIEGGNPALRDGVNRAGEALQRGRGGRGGRPARRVPGDLAQNRHPEPVGIPSHHVNQGGGKGTAPAREGAVWENHFWNLSRCHAPVLVRSRRPIVREST